MRLLNLLFCRWGWSFRIASFSLDRRHLHPGDVVYLTVTVRNDGLRIGTCYVTYELADAYKLRSPFFDSNTHLALQDREAQRLIDIQVGEDRSTSLRYKIPNDYPARPVDLRIRVWNPHKLFNGPHPYKFADTKWQGAFTVISPVSPSSVLKVFISYSWSPEVDRVWVHELAEALRRNSINVIIDATSLKPGDETTLFMETQITTCDVTLLICTETYTAKANSRLPGGVGYEAILGSSEYMISSPADRARFIPVVRNNSLPVGRKLPKYLGSSLYVDMSDSNWSAQPLQRLIEAIQRHPART